MQKGNKLDSLGLPDRMYNMVTARGITLKPWLVVGLTGLAMTLVPPLLPAQGYPAANDSSQRPAASGEAHLALAMRYYLGDGVPRNYEKAAEFFLLAARAKNSVAQFNVGYMYQLGIGLPVDYVQACIYYQAAANQGYESAFTPVAELYRFMSEEQIVEIGRQASQLN